MHKLNQQKCYKLEFGSSLEEYERLLSVKKMLGERFYVRNIDNKCSGFVVGMLESDLGLLSEDVRERVIPMSDEGIVRNKVSILYRMIEEQYIDEFLSEGKLRLSTFSKCSHHESEDRRDALEGSVTIHAQGVKAASGQVGSNAYLLCTSLSLFASNPHNYKTCLCIQEAEALMNAITFAIRKQGIKVSAIVHGPCIYSTHSFEFDGIPERTEANLLRTLDTLGDRLYLIKDAVPKFMIEHEYRYLWLIDKEIEGEYLDVVIDNPKVYAQKISIPQYDKICKKPFVVSSNHPIVVRPSKD